MQGCAFSNYCLTVIKFHKAASDEYSGQPLTGKKAPVNSLPRPPNMACVCTLLRCPFMPRHRWCRNCPLTDEMDDSLLSELRCR